MNGFHIENFHTEALLLRRVYFVWVTLDENIFSRD